MGKCNSFMLDIRYVQTAEPFRQTVLGIALGCVHTANTAIAITKLKGVSYILVTYFGLVKMAFQRAVVLYALVFQ